MLEQHVQQQASFALSETALKQWLAYLHENLLTPESETARTILRQLIKKIVLKNGKGEIFYKLPLRSPQSRSLRQFRALSAGSLCAPDTRE